MADRRIGTKLPVFLIALLMQIFAPAGASLAMARAMQADPAGFAEICRPFDSSGDRTKAPGAPVSPDECCQLCHFVHSGAAPLTPQTALVIRPAPPMRRAVWSESVEHLADSGRYYHAPARAPPFAI